jgi:hypothetical protein
MNFKDISQSKKIIFFGLTLASIISLSFLIFGLVYANPENLFRKYALIIGLGFILVSRIAISFYKTSIGKHQ